LNFKIITEYPAILILLCLGLAFAYSWFLYKKDDKLRDVNITIVRILMGLRFVSVFFISFLILGPLIRTVTTHIDKPYIVIMHDNSSSILNVKDSSFYKTKYLNDYDLLISMLQKNYNVSVFSFGSSIQEDFNKKFDQKSTDFTTIFAETNNKFRNKNLGAMILLTDGIYNQGTSPLIDAANVSYPVYTVALGNPDKQKDIRFASLRSNKITFLGNKFPVQVNVHAMKLAGKKSRLTVVHNKIEVFGQDILISNDDFEKTFDLEFEAKLTGIERYSFQLRTDPEEENTKNNYAEIVIEVINSRQKILMLASSPSPDIAALRYTLTSYPNYAVDFYDIEKFNKPIDNYNLAILHQIPSLTGEGIKVHTDLLNKHIPILYILGSQSDVKSLNLTGSGISIKQVKNTYEEAQGEYNKQFHIFQLDPEIKEMFQDAPPFTCPFGDYKSTVSTNAMFFQKIRGIITDKPLIVLNTSGGSGNTKSGLIAGEGIWKWRIHEYRKTNNNIYFNSLINRIVQFLALSLNRENFVISHKTIYSDGEPVFIEAQVYNESYELINTAQVQIDIFNSENKRFTYTMLPLNSSSKVYSLNAGILPAGTYKYKASVTQDNKSKFKEGSFTVIPTDFEASNTMANHNLLYQIANQTNACFSKPNAIVSIADSIAANKNIVSMMRDETSIKEWINLKSLFFFLLVLLGIEWFVRKYSGTY